MSVTFAVAETLIQLFSQVCSRMELRVERLYEHGNLRLIRSSPELEHRIGLDIESGGNLRVNLLIAHWHYSHSRQNVIYDRVEFGSLGVLRMGLRIFGGDLHIQYIITDVSGSIATVDILASPFLDQLQRIATVRIDQHKDLIMDIELTSLD